MDILWLLKGSGTDLDGAIRIPDFNFVTIWLVLQGAKAGERQCRCRSEWCCLEKIDGHPEKSSQNNINVQVVCDHGLLRGYQSSDKIQQSSCQRSKRARMHQCIILSHYVLIKLIHKLIVIILHNAIIRINEISRRPSSFSPINPIRSGTSNLGTGTRRATWYFGTVLAI